MTFCEFTRQIARRGWGFSVKTAFMFGEPSIGSIGVEVILDPKDGALRSEVVHHEALEQDGAVLAALLRLARTVDQEFG